MCDVVKIGASLFFLQHRSVPVKPSKKLESLDFLSIAGYSIGTGKCTENTGVKGICHGESKREHNK